MKKFLIVLISALLCMGMAAFSACSPETQDVPGDLQTGEDDTQTGGQAPDSGSEDDGEQAQVPHTAGDPESDTLVVYFSWSSSQNTEHMAEYIAEQTDAYLVEIVPEEPYEGSYSDVAYGRAQEEAETNARPAVSQATYDLIDLDRYDTVLVGYPIWWHTAPMVVGTFLEHYDWTGKDIYPFSQSSSMDMSQFEESMQFVRGCAENAEVHNGLFVRPSATEDIDAYLEENGLTGNSQESETPSEESEILVVYFSATGNTESVAEYIADYTGGTLFELVPVEPYTSVDLNYSNRESRVYQEYLDESLRDVELTDTSVDNWEEYDTVFIGYPIWWGIAAWPVNDFIEDNDFTGKTVIPFCTSASSGLGESSELLAELAGTGIWQEGHRFRSSASQSDVESWVDSLDLA